MDDKINQAWDLFMQGQVQAALDLVESDFDLANCQDFSLLNLMGYLYTELQHYELALQVYDKYVALAREAKDTDSEHVGLHQLAMVYRYLQDFEKALSYIEAEKAVIDQHFPDDNLRLSVNNYEQGYLRLKLRQLDEALAYMKICLSQSLNTDDLIAQACAYRGLGEIYQAQTQLDLSATHFQKAIQLFEEAGDDIGADEVKQMLEQI